MELRLRCLEGDLGAGEQAETGWGVGNTVSKGGKVCVCGQGQLGFAIKYLLSTCYGPAPHAKGRGHGRNLGMPGPSPHRAIRE